MKESPISADDRQPYWLDNTHVLFAGFTGREFGPEKQIRTLNYGYYVWDIERDTVAKDARFEHARPECISGYTKSYVITSSPDGKTSKRRAFVDGQEIALPEQIWVNPISCRAATTRPLWIVKDHVTRPLLEEHGYLDRGGYDDALRSKEPIRYYRSNGLEPMSLGLEIRHVDPRVAYYPFADAYLLHGERGNYHAPPMWLLHPDGTIEQIFNPDGKAWANHSWSWLVLTKQGPVFASLPPPGPRSKDAGLYLWKDGSLTHLGQGYFSWGIVSPDGCKIVSFARRWEQHLPDEQRFKLKIIDVCQGGSHVD